MENVRRVARREVNFDDIDLQVPGRASNKHDICGGKRNLRGEYSVDQNTRSETAIRQVNHRAIREINLTRPYSFPARDFPEVKAGLLLEENVSAAG